MVEVKKLSLTIGKTILLSNLSCTFKEGRVTVLLGPNGSGKTSLMRVLSSMYGYEGSVLADGRELSSIHSSEISRTHSFMPQNLEPVRFTLEELLEFSNDSERANGAIRKLGLERLRKRRIDEMSNGERALSYLCLLWSQNSRLYLLDEPEASMDSRSRTVLDGVVRDLRRRNSSVLVSLHDLGRAMQIADDVCVLHEGKVAFNGTKEEFLSSRISETVFGVKAEKARTEDGKEMIVFL